MTLGYEKLRLFTQEIYNMFISQYEVLKNLFAIHAHIDCNTNLIKVHITVSTLRAIFLCDNILYNLLHCISRDLNFNIIT